MGAAIEACNSRVAEVYLQQYLLRTVTQPCKPLVRELLLEISIACKGTATSYCSAVSTMLLQWSPNTET